jgi:hypothetical protein
MKNLDLAKVSNKGMQAIISKLACVAIAVLLTSGFTAKAQESFYDTKWDGVKVETRTKYVVGNFGLYVKKSISEYTYDEQGNFVAKVVSLWNGKYEWNDKKGIWIPDYSPANWIPNYRIVRKEALDGNMVSLEYFIWDKKKKAYSEVQEKMAYRLNDSKDRFLYLAFEKDNQYTEWVPADFGKGLIAKNLTN